MVGQCERLGELARSSADDCMSRLASSPRREFGSAGFIGGCRCYESDTAVAPTITPQITHNCDRNFGMMGLRSACTEGANCPRPSDRRANRTSGLESHMTTGAGG